EDTGPAAAAIERVGPWRLTGLIGRGGSGEVHLGRRADGAFEREVAVKLLRADRNADALIVEERRLLARLDHPNIARLLDGGVAPDGRPWLVTELISGRPLDAWLRESAPDLDRRLKTFTALVDAVACAHARGIVHADLKPANVLVDAHDQPHLLDFGVARLLEHAAPAGQAALHGLTPAWAAPEQLDGLPANARSDVYALGLLLYLVLTGEAPIDAQTHALSELKALRQQQDPPAPSLRAPAHEAALIRGSLDALTLRCLARDPAQRPADAGAVLAGLRAVRNPSPVHAASRGRRPRRGTWLALAVIGALLAWGLWQQQRIADLQRRLEQMQSTSEASGKPPD
ncbi:MAG: serine/threonine protein kinase, partial [Xanthomonadales bacterium PRO6]|nr:serine/threonine protein kinase [Xanthomonadales bacterium PRO6]